MPWTPPDMRYRIGASMSLDGDGMICGLGKAVGTCLALNILFLGVVKDEEPQLV